VKLVVVTPVFEDEDAASRLLLELKGIATDHSYDLTVVAVDDGSLIKPIRPQALEQAGCAGVVISLKRNLGHQRAIAVGLHYAHENYPDAARYVVMDSDGEDRPQSVPRLLQQLEKSDRDVIVAQRRTRSEGLTFWLFYVLYRGIFWSLAGRSITFGNFMAMSGNAVRRLVPMQELWTHLAATVLASRLRIGFCPDDRGRRYDGQSKMNFVGLANHGFRSLMIFAEDALVRVGVLCTIAALLSVVGMAAALILKVAGFATPGWASTVLGLQMLIFLQTGAVTLMMLMLTGVSKAALLRRFDYNELVLRVEKVGDVDNR